MSHRIPYRKIFRAAAFLAVTSALAWGGVSNEARAQDCSRNMLRVFGPQSYVATPDAQALHLTTGFTIEYWARLDRLVNLSGVVDKGSYGIFLNADSSMFGVVRKTNPFDVTTPANDSLRNWHHFAFVFTPGDSMRFYLDSSEVASAKSSILSIDSNTDSLRIGMSLAGASWIGSIDELRIWNVSRSLAEIKRTLFHTLAGNDSGLVLYYSFDDETGSTRIHDFSGHGRDGFLRGTSAEIVPSSSPILNGSPGFRLVALESNIIIPTKRCTGSFDTVVHVRNLGSTALYVDTVGFSIGQVFSIVPNSPFTLPPDSTVIDSLRLHFEPNSGGVYFDSLYISSSSDCAGRIRVGLEATYDSVGLLASTDTVRFGTQTQCSRDTLRTITLRNTSVMDSVTILGISLPSGSGLHVLDSFPIALAKGDSVSITIALGSGARGPLMAAIAFDLDKCSREALVQVTAIRERDELSMPDTIDFGSVQSALAGVTRDTTVIVTNTGDMNSAISRIQWSPLNLLEIIDGRAFVHKAPGDTLQVHIRLHADGCGLQIGKILIQTAYCGADTSALISITTIPPSPLTAQAVDMGIACSEKDTTLYITNPNDQPLRLDSVSYSTNFIFSNSPPFTDTIPPRGSIPIPFQFNPAHDGDYTDTVYFHSSPCGIGMAVFTGTRGYDGLSFGTPQLLFGRGCKKDSMPEIATLTNSTSLTITIADSAYSGSSRFKIQPSSLPIILKPGASENFSITYFPSLGNADTGSFRLLSPDGCMAASLFLRGSRELAKAAWTNPMGEFDTICPADSAVRTFDLADRGIDSIDVMTATVTGAGFTLVQSPRTFSGAGHFQIRFAPMNEQDYSGTLTVIVDSCGTWFTLPLHGSGGPTPRISLLDTAYDFGNISVEDSGQYCFRLTNPSCTPIDLHADSTALKGTPFRIIGAASIAQIARDDTVNLCVQFQPGTYGTASATLVVSADSAPSRTIALRGVGLAPDVRFRPHLLDFGYVLQNTSKTLMVYDTNAGNLPTGIAANVSNPFAVQPPALLAAGVSDSIAVTFSPLLIGLVYDTLHFTWNGHSDSVILRGFGTEKGLQLSAVGLDFGNVHIGHDSTLPLCLFATIDFPTIDSLGIRAQAGTPAPRDTFSEFPNRILPYIIQSDGDTILDSVTYHARLKQSDTSYLVIYSGGNSTLVPLTGRGVEALPWINPDSINFPDVVLGTPSTFQPVQIKNLGGFPLYIDSIGVSDPAFSASPIDASAPIMPDSARYDTVTFAPSRARRVNGMLSFKTSYHDSILNVSLSGTGIYPLGTGPSFGYTVASITTEPGEFDTIPISMSGVRLAKIDAVSATLDIRFDPEMVRMLGADAGASASPVSRFTHLNDSMIEASVAMSTFADGTTMRLHTQALLGPHDTSYIHVIQSAPAADQTESMTDGQFIVADCGGAIHGVVFAGPYLMNAIVPNPTRDHAQLQFTLGLDGPVVVDIYNSIGQMVRHIDAGTAKAGAHSLTLDVSDLPQDRYVYRLTSLEYHSEGALVIMR